MTRHEIMVKPNLKAIVFDAYGTLFDVHSIIVLCEQLFPTRGEALSRAWRARQLEYTWLQSLMGRYEDFEQVTEAALRFACRSLHLPCEPATRAQLMDAYLHLDPFPDVRPTLEALSNFPLAILSNGSPRMLRAVVEHASLTRAFAHIISVDEVKVYKPSPRVYQLASQKLGHTPSEIGFVSANGWDAGGGKAFGFQTYWLNRAQVPEEELGAGAAPDKIINTLTELPALM